MTRQVRDLFRARENRGGWMTCDTGRIELLSRGVSYPPVSAVVPDAPMECGPDVAQRSRAWKARSVPASGPDATPMAQVRTACCRPLLTVSDRQMPVPRARGGHGRRGPTALQRGGDGHKLNLRVRLVEDDYLPRWQALVRARGSALLGRAPEVAMLVLLAAPARAGVIASSLPLPWRPGRAGGGRLVLEHVSNHSLDLLATGRASGTRGGRPPRAGR